jgi:hypothetical protein
MRNELARARPIDFNKIETDKVNIGTKVRLQRIEENNQSLCEGLPSPEIEVGKPLTPLTFTILGPWDSDLQKGIISYLAPYAQNLLSKTLGEEITDGEGKRYKITEIRKATFNE